MYHNVSYIQGPFKGFLFNFQGHGAVAMVEPSHATWVQASFVWPTSIKKQIGWRGAQMLRNFREVEQAEIHHGWHGQEDSEDH